MGGEWGSEHHWSVVEKQPYDVLRYIHSYKQGNFLIKHVKQCSPFCLQFDKDPQVEMP